MPLHPQVAVYSSIFIEFLNVAWFSIQEILVYSRFSISQVLLFMHANVAIVILLHLREILPSTMVFLLHCVMLVHLDSLMEVGCNLTLLVVTMHQFGRWLNTLVLISKCVMLYEAFS